MKNKRIISFLMTVALVFAMVPALGDTAWATGSAEGVYIVIATADAQGNIISQGAVKMDSGQKYQARRTFVGTSEFYDYLEPCVPETENGYIEWNSETGTLTLEDFHYTDGTEFYYDGTHKAVIWTNETNLDIILEGNSGIVCGLTGTTNAAIYSTGNVTITGAGILTVTSADPGEGNRSAGIWCDGSDGLNINAKVNATGGNGDTENGSSSYGVYIPNGGLEVGEKGILTAKGGTADVSSSVKASDISRSDYIAAVGGTDAEHAELLDLENLQSSLSIYLESFRYLKLAPAAKVYFQPNGGDEIYVTPQSIFLNMATALKENMFTRSGYTFAGWNTAVDGSGASYADKAEVTLAAGDLQYNELILYAQWAKKKSKSRKRNANVVGVAADPTPQDTPQVSTAQEEAQIEKVTQAEPVPPGVKLGAGVVRLSPQRVTVNGVESSVEAYNIFGTNFFKVRDLAAMLSGTPAQFNVEYDAARNAIIITKGAAYGGAVETNFTDRSESAMTSPQTVFIDGAPIPLTAYNIGGSNFFSLRDLAQFLGYNVSYDEVSNTAIIESK